MDDAMDGELLKKEGILNKIAGIASAQNTAIKNNEIEKVITLDAEKHLYMETMSEIDNSIKPFILKSKRYTATVQAAVKRINIMLNNLVLIEKENEKLLSVMELSASGRHVEAYKKELKQP
jgi:hypothetical protein